MADNVSAGAHDDNDKEKGVDTARTLLNDVQVLQRPCDLDLLLFFARHWRVLLPSEQLARLLGYPLKEIARSRDALVAAGVLTRAQDPTRAERLYVLDKERMNGGPLPAIVALASTPDGRLSLRRALTSAGPGPHAVPEPNGNHAAARVSAPPSGGVSPKQNRSGARRSSERPQRTK
jgi:hypothetical protein